MEMRWLQPRSLTQEEIVRLAQAQAYAARVTSEEGEKLEDERRNITSSVPNGEGTMEEEKVRLVTINSLLMNN